MSYMTIDVDSDNIELVNKIIAKTIHYCGIKHYCISKSVLKGYHIKFLCANEKCEACRLAFDDALRFERDYTNRPPHERNILFISKLILKNGKYISL